MPGDLPSWNDPDPLFTRYRAAWLAYLALQPEPPAEAIHFMRAAASSADPVLQAAAEELRLARDAWHVDQGIIP